MTAAVQAPSIGGIKGAAGDAAIGAVGGLVYNISSLLFGSGLIGAVINAVIAGSAIKGNRGEMIATMSGFLALSGIGGSRAAAQAPSPQVQVM